MIFTICLQVFNIHVWQTRDEQFQLLLVENRNQTLRYNVVESLKERSQSKKHKQLIIHITRK